MNLISSNISDDKNENENKVSNVFSPIKEVRGSKAFGIILELYNFFCCWASFCSFFKKSSFIAKPISKVL